MTRRLTLIVLTLAVLVPLSTAATAAANPPPLRLRVYHNMSTGSTVSFWMKHSPGWKWSGPSSRLGCDFSGDYSYSPTPVNSGGTPVGFGGGVRPVGNPYRLKTQVPPYVVGLDKAKVTCTLRHLTAKHVWLYRTITAHWNGT